MVGEIPDQDTYDMIVGHLLTRNIDPAYFFEAILEDETVVNRELHATRWENFRVSAPYQSWLRRCAIIDSFRPD